MGFAENEVTVTKLILKIRTSKTKVNTDKSSRIIVDSKSVFSFSLLPKIDEFRKKNH